MSTYEQQPGRRRRPFGPEWDDFALAKARVFARLGEAPDDRRAMEQIDDGIEPRSELESAADID